MTNYVLIAVPLFVYMGLMLEKSGLAEELLETMAMLFGKLRGGLAISVIVVGAVLAASTGIVGATVVTMGLLSLPTMLKRGYSPELSTGTICASGTLGQIIPPSIVLVLLGSVMNISIGEMFIGAVIPGLLLVVLYILWIVTVAILHPKAAPAMPAEELTAFRETGMYRRIVRAFLLPFFLILAVLGSIFAGVASPTEAAAVGALGANAHADNHAYADCVASRPDGYADVDRHRRSDCCYGYTDPCRHRPSGE
jgi:tripartite ATP-independent transporter DctM subunit